MVQGDALLYPKGYTDDNGDDDIYIDLKGDIEDMMKNASFKVISLSMNTLNEWYGKVTGTSVDYASSVSCILCSFFEQWSLFFFNVIV